MLIISALLNSIDFFQSASISPTHIIHTPNSSRFSSADQAHKLLRRNQGSVLLVLERGSSSNSSGKKIVFFQDLNQPPLEYSVNPSPPTHTQTLPEEPDPVTVNANEVPPNENLTYGSTSTTTNNLYSDSRNAQVSVDVPDDDSLAIVPVVRNEGQTVQVPESVVPPRESTGRRQLVRVTNLTPHDNRFYRNQIRKTRMVYDSLRLSIVAKAEEKRTEQPNPFRRTRADMNAATEMREAGLWLNTDNRTVRTIPGVLLGDIFLYRKEMCVIWLHEHAQAAIDYVPSSESSTGEPIAISIVVPCGNLDDEDVEDVIIHIGNDRHEYSQPMHQKLEYGNSAMERSMYYGIEVRVIRGFNHEGRHGNKYYVYDGLFRVVDNWFEVGQSGFGVHKFRLKRTEDQKEMGSARMRFARSLKVRASDIRPKGYVTLDLSKGEENMPVFLYNDIDDNCEPINFKYLARAILIPQVKQYVNTDYNAGCSCKGLCSMAGCFCLTRNGAEAVYDKNGILRKGKPIIFECGMNCPCPPNCRNRVSQRGTRFQYEVFRSREKELGVRSQDFIPAGSFVFEYRGVGLPPEQAKIFTMNGDYLVYPSQFGERWNEWGDISSVTPDYIRPNYPPVVPLDFGMDVTSLRSLSAYISRSPTPNVFVQRVLYDHNLVGFPHLMLFAMENIPPLPELTLDYGVPKGRTTEEIINPFEPRS